ncbi:CLUMA_CG018607, isoform A [Clunio marinus]|uniref:CLUMA_CG018607, isoform A n=1 Tax=Clunio marinus TaxID=568069 RepID=A0A1J1IZV7_9DIPT|nr:CLUMA_CG018607, isoform A [Clunio marinus]
MNSQVIKLADFPFQCIYLVEAKKMINEFSRFKYKISTVMSLTDFPNLELYEHSYVIRFGDCPMKALNLTPA